MQKACHAEGAGLGHLPGVLDRSKGVHNRLAYEDSGVAVRGCAAVNEVGQVAHAELHARMLQFLPLQLAETGACGLVHSVYCDMPA